MKKDGQLIGEVKKIQEFTDYKYPKRVVTLEREFAGRPQEIQVSFSAFDDMFESSQSIKEQDDIGVDFRINTWINKNRYPVTEVVAIGWHYEKT